MLIYKEDHPNAYISHVYLAHTTIEKRLSFMAQSLDPPLSERLMKALCQNVDIVLIILHLFCLSCVSVKKQCSQL